VGVEPGVDPAFAGGVGLPVAGVALDNGVVELVSVATEGDALPVADDVAAALALHIIDDASAGEIVRVVVVVRGCEPLTTTAPRTN